ncbi:MAG TPA: hypothetical protein VFW82_03990 [Dyella sp.]|nr:hypothetical protein [Dyella sp.]
MELSKSAKKNEWNRVLLVAIACIVLVETWISSRRLYALFEHSNLVGAQSVFLHIAFRYLGAAGGALLFSAMSQPTGREAEANPDHGGEPKLGEVANRFEPTEPRKAAGPAAGKPSRVMIAIFLGVLIAFIYNRQASGWQGPIFPVAAAQQDSVGAASDLPRLGSDAAVDFMLEDYARKSPAYRILLDEDEDFRNALRSIFKSIKDHDDPQAMAKQNAEVGRKLTSAFSSMMIELTPYADDDKIIGNLRSKVDIARYFKDRDPEGCKEFINGDPSAFGRLPNDLQTAARESEAAMLISGIKNRKAGRPKKSAFTQAEFASFVTRKAQDPSGFNLEDFQTLYEPAASANTAAVCRGIMSWTKAGSNEPPQTLAKFYRSILLGTQ